MAGNPHLYSLLSLSLSMEEKGEQKEMSFIGHLEVLRWHLVRSVAAVFVLATFFFLYNEIIFDHILFAPLHSNFITYRFLCKLSHFFGMGEALCLREISFTLINIDLSGQFTTHIWVSIIAGLIAASPYVLWEFWRFVEPALSPKEKSYTTGVVFYASVLFFTGVMFSYCIIVPMTVNFLGNYQVSVLVKNNISMGSYISTVTLLTLIIGLVFELPIIIFFLTKTGLVGSAFMRRYRKHAAVAVLLVAAVITPTSDIPTLILVSLPLYVLYEASIWMAKHTERKNQNFS